MPRYLLGNGPQKSDILENLDYNQAKTDGGKQPKWNIVLNVHKAGNNQLSEVVSHTHPINVVDKEDHV